MMYYMSIFIILIHSIEIFQFLSINYMYITFNSYVHPILINSLITSLSFIHIKYILLIQMFLYIKKV